MQKGQEEFMTGGSKIFRSDVFTKFPRAKLQRHDKCAASLRRNLFRDKCNIIKQSIPINLL